MTDVSDATLWATIITLGIGTFLIRFSFLGLVGARQLPPMMMRLLRYVPVTVIPALVTPMVVWPRATGGETDPVRLIAAMVALAVGAVTRNSLAAIITGLATLWTLPALLG
ncbi:MAG: branched-subunit amino acid transport protein [Paracoccaceae bacterium]|jgi:branched-subunit amino acid transport protein